MTKGKSLIRALNRRGSRTTKKPAVAAKGKALPDPSCCERCGAIFSRQTWRKGRAVTQTLMTAVHWTVCPACHQADSGEYYGRVVLRGAFVAANEDAIRRRIENVAALAGVTQPERRLVAIDRDRDGLDVLTTSQKLAHRIVHELKKTFRGRASYAWSDTDGSLFATWQRDDVRSAGR